MKNTLFIFLCLLTLTACESTDTAQNVLTSDIANFWEAYDQIKTTSDPQLQKTYLRDLFLDKGTPGLEAIMKARRYTAASYLDAINNYPSFWESIRDNTLKADQLAPELEMGIEQLRAIYPDLKPAKIYFTIGALKTNGTAMDDLVLIGSELAMADESAVTDDLPENFGHLRDFFDGNPSEHIVFLNIHEYVHTQQKTHGGYDLLSQSLFEGIAEFIPVIAMGKPSPTPAIAYGKANEEQIKEAFSQEMFSPFYNNWIWNSTNNVFGVRDLGYYVGYAIAAQHYEAALDKEAAIKTLIELDFEDPKEIEAFVEQTGYFSRPLAELKAAFEASRPKVSSLQPFENGSQTVDPNITAFTLDFSEPLDSRFRNFDYGPLGEDAVLMIRDLIDFSPDGTNATFEIAMDPGKRYQIVVDQGFRTKGGIPLQPYLIDFKTAAE